MMRQASQQSGWDHEIHTHFFHPTRWGQGVGFLKITAKFKPARRGQMIPPSMRGNLPATSIRRVIPIACKNASS